MNLTGIEKSKGAVIVTFAVIFILTNRWMPWDQGVEYLYGQDVPTYVAMAESVPDFYRKPDAFHLAQRVFPSYLVGTLANVLQINISTSFYILAALAAVLIIWLMHKIFVLLELSDQNYVLCMLLLIFNPYLFRFHALVPGSLQGLVFILGSIILILGLIQKKIWVVLFGMIIGVLGRQTALLLLPGILLWMMGSNAWSKDPIKTRITQCVIVFLILICTYTFTIWVATLSGAVNENIKHIFGIIPWIQDNGFKIAIIGELAFRCVIPHLIPISLIAAIIYCEGRRGKALSQYPMELWALLCMSLTIIVQPIMAGPLITGYPKGSGTRLGMMGIIATICALAYVLKNTRQWLAGLSIRGRLLFGCLIILSSFHHMYSLFGPQSSLTFALMSLIVAASSMLVVVLMYTTEQRLSP